MLPDAKRCPGFGSWRFNPRAWSCDVDRRLREAPVERGNYLPPSALQSGVVRDGRPIARKASGVMPSVWVTLSTRATILFVSVPSAFTLTSVTNTEPVA